MSISKIKKYVLAWLPAILWCLVIFYFSHQPDASAGLTPLWNFIIAKFAHISEYFILTLLVFRGFQKSKVKETVAEYGIWQQSLKGKIIYFAASLSLLYACSDEFHQFFVIGRHSSFKDILIDSVGILIAILFVKNS